MAICAALHFACYDGFEAATTHDLRAITAVLIALGIPAMPLAGGSKKTKPDP